VIDMDEKLVPAGEGHTRDRDRIQSLNRYSGGQERSIASSTLGGLVF
jgi:hypothetical protein